MVQWEETGIDPSLHSGILEMADSPITSMMEILNLAAFILGSKNIKVIFIDCLPNAEYVLET